MVGSSEMKMFPPPDFLVWDVDRQPTGFDSWPIKEHLNRLIKWWLLSCKIGYSGRYCGDDTVTMGGMLRCVKLIVRTEWYTAWINNIWRTSAVTSSGDGWAPPGLHIQETLCMNKYLSDCQRRYAEGNRCSAEQ